MGRTDGSGMRNKGGLGRGGRERAAQLGGIRRIRRCRDIGVRRVGSVGTLG